MDEEKQKNPEQPQRQFTPEQKRLIREAEDRIKFHKLVKDVATIKWILLIPIIIMAVALVTSFFR